QQCKAYAQALHEELRQERRAYQVNNTEGSSGAVQEWYTTPSLVTCLDVEGFGQIGSYLPVVGCIQLSSSFLLRSSSRLDLFAFVVDSVHFGSAPLAQSFAYLGSALVTFQHAHSDLPPPLQRMSRVDLSSLTCGAV
ncbi:unnamed protein product, partial [Durusdinium trenchii]